MEPITSVSVDPARHVVAAILTNGGRVGMFRRSAQVSSDVWRWHCISGYLPVGTDPLQQTYQEINEETGIGASDLELRESTVLEIHDGQANLWRIHAFHFESKTDIVSLNWEHDASCWLFSWQIAALATVSWHRDLINALSNSITMATSAMACVELARLSQLDRSQQEQGQLHGGKAHN